jgi:hypothetical protein
MSAGTTRDGTTRDSAIAAQGERGGGRILLIILAFLLVFALGGGALYWLSTSYGTSADGGANKGNKARSYRTLAKTELRGEPNQAARLVVSLRESTTVSGIPAGNQDGVEWLEITAVDGTKGFAPKTLFKELGPATAATEIRGGTRRLIVSVTVWLKGARVLCLTALFSRRGRTGCACLWMAKPLFSLCNALRLPTMMAAVQMA